MKRILTLIFVLFVCLSGKAQEVEISGSRKAVRTSGDVLAFITPVASLTTVLVLQDWQGLKQGALAGVSTIGMTYALKYLIKKERPDGSDKHSFPSMHTSVSIYGSCVHPTALWLEMGNSGLCDCLICRMEPDICQEARLVGRSGGSCSRSWKRLHFYPSVCYEA